MKKNILKKLGIMILGVGLIATTVAGCGGCGDKNTKEVPATEVLEAVVDTEIPETEEAEPTEVEETETEEAAFTVTDMSAIKYAKQTVNVRKGPSADYEKLGSLSANQEVTVTGQADNGWYRIEYNGTEGYVSDKYLTDQMTSAGSSGTSNANTGTKKENSAASAPASGSTNASSGSSADTGTPSAGNSSSGNSSADVTTPSTGNSSSGDSSAGVTTPSTGNSGTGTGTSTPSADTSNTTTTPDTSAGAPSTDAGSADAGGSSNVTTPPAGSVVDSNTGMWIPDDIVIEDWSGMQGGSDDGSDLGGSSTWY